ncbi:hypothetical protein L0U85_05365 [Glycomyces sp. L485]|uniref:hypothetical protein n=1 Tax=Glycomyces sp. L485 TaxID=2909235 RepID=UPI001F4A9F0A|nr:hypothetical protein [Glycomyces sp. L485]MCH7230286.1 hypothetical protein [Glycomyces sp. L485]
MTPSDNDRATIPYGERYTWGYLTTTITVPVVYTVYILNRLADTTAADIAYQRPLLIAIGASILMNMFVAPPPRKGRDRRDERDKDIHRRGEHIGFYILAFAMIGPFALAMLEAEYFWIASAMYLAYVLNAITASVTKLVLYHRGW